MKKSQQQSHDDASDGDNDSSDLDFNLISPYADAVAPRPNWSTQNDFAVLSDKLTDSELADKVLDKIASHGLVT